MARLTLRLPESLHDALARRADEEGISLNQYLVYTLTKAAALESVASQRTRFDELRNRFSDEESEHALAEMLAERR